MQTAAKSWTRRDIEILDALSTRIHLMSLNQIARTWWPNTKNAPANAKGRLSQLQDAGLISNERLMLSPELPLAHPLLTWAPGDPIPEFSSLAYRLTARWTDAPILTQVYTATKRAAQHFGGHGGRPIRSTERTHDLHLAAVFLIKRQNPAFRTDFWLSESSIYAQQLSKNEKLPDALIKVPRTAIEFGGEYDKYKLRAFHDYCAQQNLSYELW